MPIVASQHQVHVAFPHVCGCCVDIITLLRSGTLGKVRLFGAGEYQWGLPRSAPPLSLTKIRLRRLMKAGCVHCASVRRRVVMRANSGGRPSNILAGRTGICRRACRSHGQQRGGSGADWPSKRELAYRDGQASAKSGTWSHKNICYEAAVRGQRYAYVDDQR